MLVASNICSWNYEVDATKQTETKNMKYIKTIIVVTLAAGIGLYLVNRFLPTLADKIGLFGTGESGKA